ncbi:glutamate--tRNA ligase [Leeia sp. TBRC 13508]|uniref:Glutamate--tRNA ligase n=1 Tax=Leeia speluncae TaxID=2884804 RepID=A0ABS8D1T4_9NEIS|nr:glutamate--tRNA ligase [Leeia speluncae]MCB6182152.1 glutamate--tRNA ligase [Leeia speluncae]
MSDLPLNSAVRTRFAPSPTGFLHIGGARTALFSYAYARHHGGKFVLRIEDTDLERSTPESVKAIFDAMVWLDLDYDEGPFYQMQRMDRYKVVLASMLEAGTAYKCYCSKEELETMRAEQEARGEKPRYDRRWRPEPGKVLPEPPVGVDPVIRFRTPLTGVVGWDDMVKGRIEFSNEELDDLIIARPDGTPTYNFCVVVDDWDMGITQVIRGDDHVNNTPRQINILLALNAPLPQYGHVPMILREDGQKMSKRYDAVSVMQYEEMGILPEALLNYLARLGWGHGDDELFTREQFVEWFDTRNVSGSPSRFDLGKLKWVNAHYIKQSSVERLAGLVKPFLVASEVNVADEAMLLAAVALYKDRVETIKDLAEQVKFFFVTVAAPQELLDQHLTDAAKPWVAVLASKLSDTEWTKEAIAALMKAVVAESGLKFPQLAMPVRALVCGTTQTPSIDAVLAALPKTVVLARLAS